MNITSILLCSLLQKRFLHQNCLRELDSLHFITGIIYPNRCDNEAYISVKVDLTAMNAYLARKNEEETDFP